jgi:hypothetical protein
MAEIHWVDLFLGGVIAMILQYFVVLLARWWESRKGEWHGTWYEIIPSYQGLPERWDKVHFIQRGNLISGSAQRFVPAEEKERHWQYEGYVSGDRMIGFYYIKDQKIDPASYGPVIMARDPRSRHEAVWRGVYVRPQFTSDGEIFDGNIQFGEMWWQRSDPNVRYLDKQTFQSRSEQVRTIDPDHGKQTS